MTPVIRQNFMLSRLQAIVEKHRAKWELLPMSRHDAEGPQQWGFQLALWGSHQHPTDARRAHCFDCRLARTDLLKIAEWASAVACELRESSFRACDIRPRDSLPNDLRCRVIVEIALAPADKPDAQFAFCDGRCATYMMRRLRRIGARSVES